MEAKRNDLAGKLEHVIGKLYMDFDSAAVKHNLEAQIEMLEKALREAEA